MGVKIPRTRYLVPLYSWQIVWGSVALLNYLGFTIAQSNILRLQKNKLYLSGWGSRYPGHRGGGGGGGGTICDFSADYPWQHSVRILGSILFGVCGRGGTICDFSADYPWQHSVRILGSILFCWQANIFLIWSRSRLLHSFWAEPIIRWEKTGDPREKPPDNPQAELGLSPEPGSNPQRWEDERFRSLKFSGLNHSAKGAAGWQIAIFFLPRGQISKVRNSISYDSLDHVYLRAFLFSIQKRKKKKKKNGKKWSQEPVCGSALGRRWGGGG